MATTQVAVAGLGRVGGRFLEALLEAGVTVAAVAQPGDTPGKAFARAHGIPVLEDALDLLELPEVEVLFDLTGSEAVRRRLRERLAARGDTRVVVAPESVARLVWQLVAGDRRWPELHSDRY
ncbi:MAG: homoserine dehydrogenase [Firmicutes bacterium]|nr:homoserine dehydrogenase [Bacillota bacterium]